MELIEIMEESACDEHNATFERSGAFERIGGDAEAGGRIVVKRVERETGACYDADEFFRLTRPRYPESVVSDGRVVGYDNEMVIRYLDRVIVNDQDYEVRFKGGITATV